MRHLFAILIVVLSLSHVVFGADNLPAESECGNADTCEVGYKCWDNTCTQATADSPPNGLGNRCAADNCCPNGSGLICIEGEARCVPNNRFTPAIACNDPNHQAGEFNTSFINNWGPFQQTSTGTHIAGVGDITPEGVFIPAANQTNPYNISITETGIFIPAGPDGQQYDIPFTSSGVFIPGIGQLNITGVGSTGAAGGGGDGGPVVDASTGGIVISDPNAAGAAFTTTSLFSLLALAASVALLIKGQ